VCGDAKIREDFFFFANFDRALTVDRQGYVLAVLLTGEPLGPNFCFPETLGGLAMACV